MRSLIFSGYDIHPPAISAGYGFSEGLGRMDELLVRSKLLRFLEDRERTTAELWRALDEVKLWRYGVAEGLVNPEQANRCIESAKRTMNMKLHALGFPKFPS